MLERGAVEGQAFHRGAVQALAPEDADVGGRLVRLVRKELVRPERAVLPGEDAYRFRHLLIRDAAYDALPKATRAELHERFAEWLDAHGETLVERDEVVGYHLEQAFRYRSELGPVDDAVAGRGGRGAARGGRAARLGLGDTAAAVNLLERSLDARPATRADPRLELALVPARCSTPGAWRTRWTAPSARPAAPPPRATARPSSKRRDPASLPRVPCRPDRRARRTSTRSSSGPARARGRGRRPARWRRLWAAIGWIHHGACRMDQQAEAYQRAAEHAAARRRPAAARRAAALRRRRRLRRDRPRSTEAIAWLEEHARRRRPVVGHLALRRCSAHLGRFDEADALHERRSATWMRERGMLLAIALISQNDWTLARLREDAEAAERGARRGYEALMEQGHRGWASTAAAQLALSLCDLGRYDEAERLAIEARRDRRRART